MVAVLVIAGTSGFQVYAAWIRKWKKVTPTFPVTPRFKSLPGGTWGKPHEVSNFQMHHFPPQFCPKGMATLEAKSSAQCKSAQSYAGGGCFKLSKLGNRIRMDKG